MLLVNGGNNEIYEHKSQSLTRCILQYMYDVKCKKTDSMPYYGQRGERDFPKYPLNPIRAFSHHGYTAQFKIRHFFLLLKSSFSS